jgi:LmbE family N-acetylglucosaminyl deacetylase
MPGARVVVLSPHLDDAVLSLGAAIDHAVRCGLRVDVVTVFAGDVASERRAGRWDRRSGFRLEGEVATARRHEDADACRALGARPVWLDFGDEQYAQNRDAGEILAAVARSTSGADLVLTPGFPLDHPDHAALAQLVAGRDLGARACAVYAEQPYAYRSRRSPGGDGWQSVAVPDRSLLAKDLACRCYRSQLRLLPRSMLRRIREYEEQRGGESIRPAPGAGERLAQLAGRQPDGRLAWIAAH